MNMSISSTAMTGINSSQQRPPPPPPPPQDSGDWELKSAKESVTLLASDADENGLSELFPEKSSGVTETVSKEQLSPGELPTSSRADQSHGAGERRGPPPGPPPSGGQSDADSMSVVLSMLQDTSESTGLTSDVATNGYTTALSLMTGE